MFVLASSPAAGSIEALLAGATSFVTWVIAQMSSLLAFIADNAFMFIFVIILVAGSAIGFLSRIWTALR